MSYLLDATSIKRPNSMQVDNDTIVAQNRVLSGAKARDYMGSNKRVWVLEYVNTTKAYFDIINTIYQSYLSTGTVKSFEITEANYSVSSTNVHVYLLSRGFNVRGSDYLSDFTLILTEA